MEKKIRFGVIGTNKITDHWIAGAIGDPRFQLSAVCSRSEERGVAFAAKYGIPHVYTNVESLASSPYVDAVYIATPNSVHACQSIICMEGGKDVLCEKPLAANASQARDMIAVAHRTGRTLMEAMITTLNPNFNVIREKINTLGTIRRYFAAYCQYSSRYDSFKEGIVLNAFHPDLANGAVMDIGVYTLYPLVTLFGAPSSVQASGLLLSTGVDGQGTATLSYPGMSATVIYSKIADSYLPSEIEGEEGTLLIDCIHVPRQVSYVPRRLALSGRGSTPQPQPIGVPVDRDIYYYEVKEFIDLIVEGKQESAVNSWAHSLATLEVIDEVRCQVGVIF